MGEKIQKMNALYVGNIIKELRQSAGMTQNQLAAQLGISKSSISFYELNVRIPGAVIVANMASVFHVSTDYLLGVDRKKRTELTGLTDQDIEYVENLITLLRAKNKKWYQFTVFFKKMQTYLL